MQNIAMRYHPLRRKNGELKNMEFFLFAIKSLCKILCLNNHNELLIEPISSIVIFKRYDTTIIIVNKLTTKKDLARSACSSS